MVARHPAPRVPPYRDAAPPHRLAVVIDVSGADPSTLEALEALAGDFASLVSRLSPTTTARVSQGVRRAGPPGTPPAPTPVPVRPVPDAAPTDRRLVIDFAQNEVTVDGQVVDLAHKEFQVLALLALRSSRVVSREELMGVIWRNSQEQPAPRTVDVYVQRIRTKLGPHRRAVVTIRGTGYRFHRGPSVTLTGIDRLFADAASDDEGL